MMEYGKLIGWSPTFTVVFTNATSNRAEKHKHVNTHQILTFSRQLFLFGQSTWITLRALQPVELWSHNVSALCFDFCLTHSWIVCSSIASYINAWIGRIFSDHWPLCVSLGWYAASQHAFIIYHIVVVDMKYFNVNKCSWPNINSSHVCALQLIRGTIWLDLSDAISIEHFYLCSCCSWCDFTIELNIIFFTLMLRPAKLSFILNQWRHSKNHHFSSLIKAKPYRFKCVMLRLPWFIW